MTRRDTTRLTVRTAPVIARIRRLELARETLDAGIPWPLEQVPVRTQIVFRGPAFRRILGRGRGAGVGGAPTDPIYFERTNITRSFKAFRTAAAAPATISRDNIFCLVSITHSKGAPILLFEIEGLGARAPHTHWSALRIQLITTDVANGAGGLRYSRSILSITTLWLTDNHCWPADWLTVEKIAPPHT
ncbi:hypothetical protein EVAR_26796_1 [Eumeta japonica]|uniref:Uncharacterized protein n=1 Tax=Eumeta variegata TaxID=151549 RepID=A0A4C1WCH0_EUMVA|nr:hypothetical protein EVAR_26796_1 [Eumeta japonica]